MESNIVVSYLFVGGIQISVLLDLAAWLGGQYHLYKEIVFQKSPSGRCHFTVFSVVLPCPLLVCYVFVKY